MVYAWALALLLSYRGPHYAIVHDIDASGRILRFSELISVQFANLPSCICTEII